MDFVLRIVFFLIIGAVSGALLTLAGKLFFVKTDETVEKITEALRPARIMPTQLPQGKPSLICVRPAE